MTDAIDAAIDSVQSPVESAPAVETPAVSETPAPAPSAPESMDAKLEAIYDRHNPPRAPDGKFAQRNPEAAVEAQETETTEELTDQTQQGVEGQPAVETPAVTEPPQAWSAAQKELWASIPPAAQEFVAKREAEAHKAITRMGQELSRFRPLNELLTTHKDTFARHGVEPQMGIAQLLDIQTRFDEDPYGTIAAIAEQYGVDLTAFAGQQQPEQANGNAAPPDPVIHGLQQQVHQLTQRLSERERREQQEQQRQTQELQRQTDEEVGKWAIGKDFYEEPSVKTSMAAFIQTGQADTLDEAYDMACYAVPAIRQKMREQERKTEEAKRAAEAKKHASEAKRAAPINTGSTARKAASVPSGKWDDISYLENVYDRAQGS